METTDTATGAENMNQVTKYAKTISEAKSYKRAMRTLGLTVEMFGEGTWTNSADPYEATREYQAHRTEIVKLGTKRATFRDECRYNGERAAIDGKSLYPDTSEWTRTEIVIIGREL